MWHLIVNPVAGRGRSLRQLERVRVSLEQKGLAHQVHLTEAPGHAAHIAAALPEDASLLALGGDGTLHEVASACIRTGRTLGVIPGGSGDDFAWALGLGRRAPEAALAHSLSGHVLEVDTATVDGTPFINALGTGFDAQVAHNFALAPRVLRARAAYLYTVAATLRTLECQRVSVTVDGSPFYSGPALLASVQNGPRTGGSFTFAPDASLTDGRLDVVIAGHVGVRNVLNLLPNVLRGARLDHPHIHQIQGKHVVIEWEEAVAAHMEGQLLGARRRFEVEAVPRSLRVLRQPLAESSTRR